MLHLGTARQYLSQWDVAQTLFLQALALAQAHDIREQVHFMRHHQGRCYAEQGKIAAAYDCFDRALALRERLGIERFIASSQAALADLADW